MQARRRACGHDCHVAIMMGVLAGALLLPSTLSANNRLPRSTAERSRRLVATRAREVAAMRVRREVYNPVSLNRRKSPRDWTKFGCASRVVGSFIQTGSVAISSMASGTPSLDSEELQFQR